MSVSQNAFGFASGVRSGKVVQICSGAEQISTMLTLTITEYWCFWYLHLKVTSIRLV